MPNLRQIYHRIKPYLIIVHPPSGNAAVYNRDYEKLSEWASERLIAYASQNNTQVEHGFKLTKPEQQPSWLTDSVKAECVSYHVYNDGSSTKQIGDIPEEY